MSIIYCITNKVNNKKYIGQSICPPKIRFQNHIWKLSKKSHYNSHLQSAWNKYGREAFIFEVILCGNFEIEELNKLERDYIKLYDCFVNGYNQNEGGYNRCHTQETKDKISLIKKELYKTKGHHWNGRTHTQKSKKRMSESRIGSVPWNKGKEGVQINNTIYKWAHKNGDVEICTAYDLCVKYELNRSHIGKVYRNERKSHKGWKCNGKVS